MPNPKDWFRRRRIDGEGDDAKDPFAEEGVLDLGRAAVMLRDSVPLAVPRPPRRAVGEGRLLQSSAFTVRPELARRDRPRLPETPSPTAPISLTPAPRPERLAGDRHEPARADALPAPGERRGPVAFRLSDHRLPPAAPAREPRVEKFGAQAPPPAAPEPRLGAKPVPEPRTKPALEPRPGVKPTQATSESAFTLAAPGPALMRGRPRDGDLAHMHALLRDAFTPTRPKHDASMFSGRFREMQRIIAAIEEERAHVVVFGERGSGKTSLCNILAGKASEAGYFVQHYACSSGVGFEEIFRNFLRHLPGTLLADGLGAGSRRVENFAQLVPEGPLGIHELVEIFARIHDRHVILIIDEYDRVVDEDVKARLAELIKIMSDAAVPVTLLLIGVADDVRALFGKHPSLQRTLVTVPMPLMPRRDIEGLIAAGEAHAGLAFAADAREAIIDLAQGLPYEAQLLCLLAARSAVRRNSRQVEREDLRYAVERAVDEAESRVKEGYGLAVGSPVESTFEDVLFQAARARSDEFGTFTAADVAAAGPSAEGADGSLLALQIPLKKLTEAERGGVLRRLVSPAGPRYQFCTQMFRNYVLVHQAVLRGMI